MGNIKDYAVTRRVDYFEDNESKEYIVIVYLFVRLFDNLEDDDELDGEILKELFEFSIFTENNTIVKENLDLEFIDPYSDDMYPFSKMEELFEEDVKEYGNDLKELVDINEIKNGILRYIKEQ
ncbi:MAG: hypothetical protein P8N74_05440 [Polaribacter sp.]|nr:hypothetical protein [Polaribacter sp.]